MTPRSIALIGSSALVVGACASALLAPSLSGDESETSYVSAVIRSQAQQSDGSLFTPDRLTQALPSTTYVWNEREVHASTVAATGLFSDPREAKAVLDREQPESGDVSPAWKRGTVTFTVKSIISSAEGINVPRPGQCITVELYFGPDVDVLKAEEQLTNLGNSVAFLSGGFADDPSSWSISENGTLIGAISDDGHFQMFSSDRSSDGQTRIGAIVVDANTVGQLEEAAAKPVRVNLADDHAKPSAEATP